MVRSPSVIIKVQEYLVQYHEVNTSAVKKIVSQVNHIQLELTVSISLYSVSSGTDSITKMTVLMMIMARSNIAYTVASREYPGNSRCSKIFSLLPG